MRGTHVSADAPRELAHSEFRDVIGHFTSGVTVVTARHESAAFGTTASAVSSLSLEPPMLLVCMNQASSTGRAIAASLRYGVNILSEDQSHLAVRFATKAKDKFDGVALTPSVSGVPLLAGALATLECRVVEAVTGGTHWVFLAEVERASAGGGSPLAYFRGQFGRLDLTHDESALVELRRRVLHREIAVGEPLDLDALAAQLGAPRGSVYHGLAKLSGEGLVDRDAGGSFVVRPVTLRAVLDSVRARFAILLGAAALQREPPPESELAGLRRALAATRPTRPDRTRVPIDAWFRARTEFVETLIGLTGSAALVEAFRRADVAAMILGLWSGGAAPALADLERIHRAYRDIVEAYARADLPALRRTAADLLDFYEELHRATFTRHAGI